VDGHPAAWEENRAAGDRKRRPARCFSFAGPDGLPGDGTRAVG